MNQSPVPAAATPVRCPTCGRQFVATESTAVPFCSSRCRLIDLGRWFKEEQSLAVEPHTDEEE